MSRQARELKRQMQGQGLWQMLRRSRKNTRGQEGFSLVELAVVLVVIGLVIAAILKGQDMIENARLKKVMSQVNEYRVATSAFLDRYDAYPGDFNKASTQISTDAPDGNGNGVVEGTGLSGEALHFWSHLAHAKLISPPGRMEDLGTAEFGKGAPSTAIGGGFTVESTPEAGMTGLWLILGNVNGNGGKGALLTPQQALSIDMKFDNGEPTSGNVQSRDGSNVAAGSCIASGAYNTQNEKPACVVYFKL